MANLLIGSSNVYRHYRVADFPNIRNYKMLKCTQIDSYAAHLTGLVPDNKNVLISVFENFVVDAVGQDEKDLEEKVDECIKNYLAITLEAALNFPTTKFGLVMPLRRPSVKWYNERVDCISKFMMDGIKAMISDRNINNVAAINNISLASQQLGALVGGEVEEPLGNTDTGLQGE